MLRLACVLGTLAVFLILGVLIGIAFGPAKFGFQDLMTALVASGDPTAELVVWGLRMPRVAASLLVGCCLGVAGSLLQLSTRNPLGDPQIFGVSGGAAVVQALSLTGVVRLEAWSLVTISIVASLIGAGVIAQFASKEDISPARLALIGVSVAALCLAGASGILAHSRIFTQQSLAFLGGSLANRGWQEFVPALPFLGLGLALALAVSGRLNLLTLGDRIAAGLGGEPGRTRVVAMASAGILGGTAVAVGGMMGFVGLLVPHIARLLVGYDARRIILTSIPLGAVVTLYADQIARLAFMPSEVPVGMVTTIIGAPMMIYVARRIA